jgi:hypothetical protein
MILYFRDKLIVLILFFGTINFSIIPIEKKLEDKIIQIIRKDLLNIHDAYGSNIFMLNDADKYIKGNSFFELDRSSLVKKKIIIDNLYYNFYEVEINVDRLDFHHPNKRKCREIKLTFIHRKNELYRLFGFYNSDIRIFMDDNNLTNDELITKLVKLDIIKKGKEVKALRKSLKNKNKISLDTGKKISLFYSLYGCTCNYLKNYRSFFESNIIASSPPVDRY